MKKNRLPELIYIGKEQEKLTLHLFFQIIGKIRMSFTPRKNHWWYITLYISEKGFTTGAIPFDEGFESFSITFNLINSRLEISVSNGSYEFFELKNGLSVAEFYSDLRQLLKKLEIPVTIHPKPFDQNIDRSFSEISDIHNYDREYSYNFWKVFRWVDVIFKEFSGRFYGKTCPVHLYWHSMDLAVTRFSGREAPKLPQEARLSDKDAYSHECISFGFWAGDENMKEPAFYSYTYPSPDNLSEEILQPSDAKWIMNNGSPMAILTYADLQKSFNPREILLNFLESAYRAGAKLANWDIEKLEVPPLKSL